MRKVSTTADADCCGHESGYPGRPAFRASSTRGYVHSSPQIRVVICPCPSSPSTCAPFFRFGFAVSSPLAWSRRPRMGFLFVTWQVLARRCPATILCWLTDHLRRLPLHGPLPRRSCPRLVSVSYELSIWYDDSQRNTGTEHRGLAPHKITPMLGVLQRSGGGDVSDSGESTPAAR